MLRSLLGLLFLGPVLIAQAQQGDGDALLYPEKLREDTEVLRVFVHEAHPDPYRYGTKAELDLAFDRLMDSLVVPVTAARYQELLMPLFHRIGDAHCFPELGVAERENMRHDVPIIPLKVRVLADGLFVEEELKGFRSLPPGAQILSINAVPVTDLLQRMESLLVVDGANLTLMAHLIERDFPYLLNRVMGDTSIFSLHLQVNEADEVRTIFAMTGDEIARSRKPSGAAMMPWRAEREPESSAMWVTLRTLEADSLDRAGQNGARFLSAMLQDITQNQARTLVLDLRGAAGSDPAMAELVFAAVAKEPFRAVQGVTARSTAPPHHYDLVTPIPEYYASLEKDYVPDEIGTLVGRPGDERLELKAPMHDAFTGRLYVVCDGATRDAAALLVMLTKRTGRARIVGEETGSNAFSFTGGGELLATLPNAGIQVHVPLLRYLPEGLTEGAKDHGEMPNHALQQQPWGIAKGRDTVKETVLRMLRELE